VEAGSTMYSTIAFATAVAPAEAAYATSCRSDSFIVEVVTLSMRSTPGPTLLRYASVSGCLPSICRRSATSVDLDLQLKETPLRERAIESKILLSTLAHTAF
jgi:hypothetical protein